MRIIDPLYRLRAFRVASQAFNLGYPIFASPSQNMIDFPDE